MDKNRKIKGFALEGVFIIAAILIAGIAIWYPRLHSKLLGVGTVSPGNGYATSTYNFNDNDVINAGDLNLITGWIGNRYSTDTASLAWEAQHPNVGSSTGVLPLSNIVSSTWLQTANNLSDLPATSTARTNIGYSAGTGLALSSLGVFSSGFSSSTFTNVSTTGNMSVSGYLSDFQGNKYATSTSIGPNVSTTNITAAGYITVTGALSDAGGNKYTTSTTATTMITSGSGVNTFSTTATTTLATISIPGGTLGTTGDVKVYMYFVGTGGTGSVPNVIFSASYAGQATSSLVLTNDNALNMTACVGGIQTVCGGILEVDLLANNSASSQIISLSAPQFNSSTVSVATISGTSGSTQNLVISSWNSVNNTTVGVNMSKYEVFKFVP